MRGKFLGANVLKGGSIDCIQFVAMNMLLADFVTARECITQKLK